MYAKINTLNIHSSASDANNAQSKRGNALIQSPNQSEQRQSTPTNQRTPIKDPTMMRIQRDLNSPSATVRVRALRALKNCTRQPYTAFDIPHAEQSIISSEERHTPPPQPTLQELMQNITVYVEVRTGEDNRSEGVKKVISELGARVNNKLLRDTTHVIFKDGLLSTYKKAKNWNIPVVSILWIEACKNKHRICDPKSFPISNEDRYENPELYEKMKRHRSMQPDSECNKRKRVRPATAETAAKTTANNEIPAQHKTARKKDSDIPTLTSNRNKTEITYFFKQLNNHTRTAELASDRATESPATKFLNKISSGSLAPITTASKTSLTNTLVKEIHEEEKRNVEAAYSDNGSARKLSDIKKANEFDAAAGTFDLASIIRDAYEINVSKCASEIVQRRSSTVEGVLTTAVSQTATPVRMSTRRNSMNTTTTSAEPKSGRMSLRRSFSMQNAHAYDDKAETLLTESNTLCATITEEESPKSMECVIEPNRLTTYSPKPLDMSEQLPDQARPKSNNRRRTLFTPQRMDIINSISSSPLELTNDVNGFHTPLISNMAYTTRLHSKELISTPQVEVVEQDATVVGTPLFNSTREPASHRRRSVFDVSMEIIAQRLQTINNTARRSLAITSENELSVRRNSLDHETATLLRSESAATQILIHSGGSDAERNMQLKNANSVAATATPTHQIRKRKLFVPNDQLLSLTPTANTTATKSRYSPTTKTSTASSAGKKRRRTMLPSVKSSASQASSIRSGARASPSSPTNRKPTTGSRSRRRSTLDFEPLKRVKLKPVMVNTNSTDDIWAGIPKQSLFSGKSDRDKASGSPTKSPKKKKPVLVYTNMHKEHINAIRKAIAELGNFRLDYTVNYDTTHVVSYEARRTLNLLRALARGLWILNFHWLQDSMRAGKWLPEEGYELDDFSRSVKICRAERQAFGSAYRCELFSHMEPFYVSSRCHPVSQMNLKELLILCGAKVVDYRKRAKYIMGDTRRLIDDKIYLSANWVLDSVTAMQVLKFTKYRMPNNIKTKSNLPYQFQPTVQRALLQTHVENLKSTY